MSPIMSSIMSPVANAKSNAPNDAKSTPQIDTPATPSTTPQRTINKCLSEKSPIMSAKRPRKWNLTPSPHSTQSVAMASPSTAMSTSHFRSPEPSTAIRKKLDLSSNLSPMHNAKPVPKDSHHAAPAAEIAIMKLGGPALDACGSEISTGMESQINKDEVGGAPPPGSWVGRKVDAIFSPVLSFLQGAASGSSSGDGDSQTQAHSNNAEEELRSMTQTMTHTEDSEDNAGLGSTMMCDTLTQARSDSQKADNCASFETIQLPSESYESDTQMANVDGDATLRYSHEGNGKLVPVESHDTQPITNDQSYEEDYDDEEEFNPYLFIKCLPPYHYAIPPGWTSRPKALPPLDVAGLPPIPPICLVLDLDETLVHCTVEPVENADMIFPVEFNGIEYQVHVRFRPFLLEFLEAVSQKFEVVIFTASQQVYADRLLDKIDPDGKLIRHRMFRDSCLHVEGNFLKDLTILGRDLSKAVLVDNSPHVFGYQVDNGIPIESWFDDPDDKELLKLELFLRTLHGADDVRDVVREAFQIQQLVSAA